MALLTPKVEVAFTATPFADPSTLTWTDITAYLLAWSVNRGRADEQSSMQAGTCQLTLDNSDGRFDPDNGSGAYSPHVLPAVPVRISATFSGTTYYLFWGFVESWEQHYERATPTVVVAASDGMKAVLSYAVGLGYTEMLVQDYGGTIGTEFDRVWPFQGAIWQNTYLNSATANITSAGATQITAGIAETGLSLSGSSSYWKFASGFFGAIGYWDAFDGWLRNNSLPSAPNISCLFFCGSLGGVFLTPNLGMDPFTLSDADSMSLYTVQWPTNLFANAVADPTSTTGWTVTGGLGFALTTPAIATSSGVQRIWLDNGATDFFGATSALKAATSSVGAAAFDVTSPQTAASPSTAYTFGFCLGVTQASANTWTLFVDWYNASNTLLSSSTLFTGSATSLALLHRSVKLTSPAGTDHFKLRFHGSQSSTVGVTITLAQLSVLAGTYDHVLWYTGTPSNSLLFLVASQGGVAPPGQSNSTLGWPCYGTAAVPSVGSWFHVAVDSGTDTTTQPYHGTVASRGLPAVWLNGASVRLWTPGPQASDPGFNISSTTGLGSRLTNNPSGPNPSTAAAMSADELYLSDNRAGNLTGALAAKHYNYGLLRRDFLSQLSGARFTAVLDTMGWPSAQRALDTGTVTLLGQAPDTSGTSITGRQLLDDANTAEGGLWFIGRDGKVNFWDQAHAMGGSPVITLGDGVGEVHYMGWPTVIKDDTHIANLVQLAQSLTDGSTTTPMVVQVIDTASQALYNVRAKAVSAPWANRADMASLAASILADYKAPASRVAQVAVEGVTSNAFASLLPRELGDYLTVHLQPSNYTGPDVSINAYLQGIQIVGAQDGTWVFTFALSPTIAGH